MLFPEVNKNQENIELIIIIELCLCEKSLNRLVLL